MYNLWLIHVDVWQKPTQYCKAITLQLKIHKLKKNRMAGNENVLFPRTLFQSCACVGLHQGANSYEMHS